MSDRQPTEDFGSSLLQQDESLHSERYKEYRRRLEGQLARAESRERLTKRVVVGAVLVAAAVFPVLASKGFGSPVPFDRDATALSVAAGAVYVAAMATFFVGVAAYYWSLPGLRRARHESQEETIRELRRDVAELRQLVEGALQARKTDPGGPA